MFRVMETAFRDFFTSEGHQFKLLSVPEKRMMAILNHQRVDGTCAISDLKFSNLKTQHYLLADNPHGTLDVVVTATHSLPRITSIDDFIALTKANSRIGYVGGTSTEQLPDFHRLTVQNVVNLERGIRMLAAGRLDYLLTTKVLTQYAVKKIHADTRFYYSEPLYKSKLYNALHVRHRHLREPLNHYIHRLTECLKGDAPYVHSNQWPALVLEEAHPCRQTALPSN